MTEVDRRGFVGAGAFGLLGLLRGDVRATGAGEGPAGSFAGG